jgi:4-hydroxy-3-methylbut-2-enyl diphosphate reductase
MNIVRAKILGFCSGVRRAVDLAYAETTPHPSGAHSQDAHSRGPIYTLGPLIHNPQVLEELKRRGMETLSEDNLPEALHGASVIIRAHGISPQTEAELRKQGAAVIDATCAKVKSSQLKAAAFAKEGYRLFLAGEKRHAEITGICGYAEAAPLCAVVSCVAEAEKAAAWLFHEDPNVRTAIIGQTTISAEEYQDICTAISRFFPSLEIAQTICAATAERQDSLRELLNKVDAVIIAGGKDSANTRRLLAITEAADKPCALVESPADIPPHFFAFSTIGLASGTSTSDAVIDDIEWVLKNGI